MAERTPKRLLLPAVILLLLGACLLLCARKTALSDGRTEVRRLAGATLYLPEKAQSGEVSAVMMTHSPFDGGALLAAELTRRGTAVLLLPKNVPLQTGWEALCAEDFVRLRSVGLILRGERVKPGAAYAEGIAGSGREPAAVIALGTPAEMTAFQASPARNILFLSGKTPSEQALTGFYGEDTQMGRISGYFGEGNARAVRLLSGSAVPRYDGGDAAGSVLDWLGSSLGHDIEIPDGDRIMGRCAVLYAGGAALLILGLAGIGLSVRKKGSDPRKETP